MSNADGTLAEGPYTYDTFGNGPPLTGTPYKYAGMRLDPETGLYYDRARYYSSVIGRFLQIDPAGSESDLNLYAYVFNDPTDKTDPMGLYPIDLHFLAEKTTTVEIGDNLSKADQATAETAMRGAAGMVFSMEANNTLPSSSKDAYMAINSMSVSGAISGLDPKSGNFNFQMSELNATNTAQGSSNAVAWVASTGAHDGTHAIQAAAGTLPEKNFRTDPTKNGSTPAQIAQFRTQVINSERGADKVQIDFLKAVSGLPDNVRNNMIGFVSGRTDSDIMQRYEGRTQDAAPAAH
jgi:RHS repeat-associated protein